MAMALRRSVIAALLSAAQSAELHAMTEKTTPVTLSMSVATLTDPIDGGTLYTRAFDGTVPGPTIRTNPGETLNVVLTNNLGTNNPDCTTTGTDYCYVNTTNMHTHGLHVSSEAGQDDIFTEVLPGEDFTYNFEIPEYHMGGTHWYHPHVHHATALQAGGGAAGVLIVNDPADSLPAEISGMTEYVIFIGMMKMSTLTTLAGSAQGDLWSQTTASSNVAWVNGQYQPTVSIASGTWYRFRFAFAAIEQVQEITVDADCQLQLLAKDGVYLHSAPRSISSIYLVPGARADVAVACACASPPCTATFESGASRRLQGAKGGDVDEDTYTGTLFTLEISGTTVTADITALTTFAVNRPCYLADLTSATVPAANQHAIELVGGDWIVKWDGEGESWGHDSMPDALATLNVGEVHEWTVTGISGHPFHLHVSPYQITSLSTADDYFAIGDWHDTLMNSADEATVRLQTDNYACKYVIHCHVLEHEDQGMMAYLTVSGTSGTVWDDAETLDSTCYRTASGVGYTTSAATPSPSTPSPTAASTNSPTPSPTAATSANSSTNATTAPEATTTVAATTVPGGVASEAAPRTEMLSFAVVSCFTLWVHSL